MFIVRLGFKNGLTQEYVYGELGKADECRKICAAAMKEGEQCEIWDDAGRQANIAGANLQAVQLASLKDEATATYALKKFGAQIQAALEPAPQPAFRDYPADVEAPRPNGRRVFAS